MADTTATGMPGGITTNDGVPLKQSLAPAIRLARKGYVWSAKNSAMIGFRTEQLAKSKGAARAIKPGQVVVVKVTLGALPQPAHSADMHAHQTADAVPGCHIFSS